MGAPIQHQSWGHCWLAPQKRARRSHGAGETEAVLAWGKLPAHLWFLRPSPLGSIPKFQFNPLNQSILFSFCRNNYQYGEPVSFPSD